MELQVVIASEGHVERRLVSVPTGVLTIGRANECSVPLQGQKVSRHHVTVDLNGATMIVRDSSRNGTLAGAVFISNSSADVPLGVPLVVGEFTISLRRPGDDSLPLLSLSRMGIGASGALAPRAPTSQAHGT